MTTRRFLIAVQDLTTHEEDQLRKFLRSLGGWWHWIKNVWLLNATDKDITAEQIANQILSINEEAQHVVFEITGDVDWAGFGRKNKSGKDMFEWLKTWGK